MEITDYYNLKGKLIKSVDDGSDAKKLVLSERYNSASYDNAIASGAVVDVPGNGFIHAADQSYANTEATGNEYGFRVGQQGNISVIVEGSESQINSQQWLPAINDLRDKGDYVYYDVHTHPNRYDNYGNLIQIGDAAPSTTDINNTVGTHPNVVLGYYPVEGVKPGNQIGGTVPPTAERAIRYFDNSGPVGGPINYNQFKNAVRKINK